MTSGEPRYITKRDRGGRRRRSGSFVLAVVLRSSALLFPLPLPGQFNSVAMSTGMYQSPMEVAVYQLHNFSISFFSSLLGGDVVSVKLDNR